MAAPHEVIARDGTFAVTHCVERVLRPPRPQGLPAAIEDDETPDKLALLMSAADGRPTINATDEGCSTTDRQPSVHATGFVHCARPAALIEPPRRHRGGRVRRGCHARSSRGTPWGWGVMRGWTRPRVARWAIGIGAVFTWHPEPPLRGPHFCTCPTRTPAPLHASTGQLLLSPAEFKRGPRGPRQRAMEEIVRWRNG
jgi:hypothetical protein